MTSTTWLPPGRSFGSSFTVLVLVQKVHPEIIVHIDELFLGNISLVTCYSNSCVLLFCRTNVLWEQFIGNISSQPKSAKLTQKIKFIQTMPNANVYIFKEIRKNL